MGHCQGGYAAESFGARGEPTVPFEPAVNVVAATQAWVEQGTTPGEIVARAYINATVPTQGVAFTRPLCKVCLTSRYSAYGKLILSGARTVAGQLALQGLRRRGRGVELVLRVGRGGVNGFST
jgi:hypothetical protein